MNSIIILIPYFGQFPSYFNLWLKSCEYNPTINWCIYSDQDMSEYLVPQNVSVKKSTLSEIKSIAQKILSFELSLENPYKLCDYKPAYGTIFSEDIKDYDFWGYGDIDLIYGDIRKFVTDDILKKYDRVFASGHLSICKNIDRVNYAYRKKIDGCFYYKDVYTSPRNWTFDEFGQNLGGGYYQICRISQIQVFNRKLYADIYFKHNKLQCDYGGNAKTIKAEYKKKNVFFKFEKGTLFQHWDNDSGGKEVAYIHLQKRNMHNNCIDTDSYYIYPHEFTNVKKSRFNTYGYNPRYLQIRKNQILRLFRIKR